MHIAGTGSQPRLRLAEERTLRKWSQRQVADRIGTTYVNVSRWERGITKPGPYFRRKLCALYGKSEQELDLESLPETDGLQSIVPDTAKHDPAERDTSVVHGALNDLAIPDAAIPQLPAIPLIGRDRELAHIKQRLGAGGSVALTALNGLPGVGKTALTITLAHDPEIRKHFRDGVLWAALGPRPNISGLLSRWGALLGVPTAEVVELSSTEAWSKALHSAIGSRSMLLVIDDAWKIEEALAFKVGGPNCAHLLTTRFPLIAASIARDGATVIRELGEEESMTLLRCLAPNVVDRERRKAHDLVHAVGGLPLALTLMGNYLSKQAYSGLSRRITEALKRLSDVEERLQISELQAPVESHTSLPPAAPLSLQSVITVSDQQLNEQAHAAFYALSVFPPKPNSFSEEAALAVAACSVETLDTLIEAGLLESNSLDRYTLHQTIADYARVHLKEDAAYDRLITYALGYVEAHRKDYELLELESSIILAALDAANNLGRQSALVRGVTAFAPFLLSRGIYQLAEQHVRQAHEAAMTLADAYGTASTLLYLGEIAQKQGNYAEAEGYYQQGLTRALEIGDNERISALLTNLGWVALKRGEYARAEEYLQEGLNLAREIGDSERISALLEMLGSVAGSRGDYKQSEAYLQEGLALARQIGDRERMCTILINLGVTAGEQGDHVHEEVYYQEGLTLARQIGHREWMNLLLVNLGAMAVDQGNYAKAEANYQEGLALARQLEHRESISILLLSLGETAVAEGSNQKAMEYLQEALDLARRIDRPRIISNALYAYGNLSLGQHQYEAAEKAFDEMLTKIPEGDQELLALGKYGLARTASAKGNIQKAREFGEACAITFEAMGYGKAKEVRQWLNYI